MRKRGPAHRRIRNLDVRDLRGHADHEGVVEEVPRTWLLIAWELEPTRVAGPPDRRPRVIEMRIAERQDRMEREPPEQHREDRQQERRRGGRSGGIEQGEERGQAE